MTQGTPKRPAHGTREWAASNVNLQNGCEHDCKYCYAKAMAIRFKRANANTWREPRIRPHDLSRGYTARDGRIMFPTAHDITDGNIESCTAVLGKMLAAGNDVLIVSKPRPSCIKRLCADLVVYRGQITFRFSIGSAHDELLRFWEPGAPPYHDRIVSLRHAHACGFRTSVSCEPMLDADIEEVVADVRPFVTDSIWLGKMNRAASILRLNCPGDEETLRRAEMLLARQADEAIRALYKRYQDDPLIKWKDSIKKILALPRPMSAGLDE